MSDFLFVGTHVEDLASGRTLAPGEEVTLSGDELNDPHNKRLVDDGVLIPKSVAAEPEPDKGKGSKKSTGREGDGE